MRCLLFHMFLLVIMGDSYGQDIIDGHRFIRLVMGPAEDSITQQVELETVSFPQIEEYDIRTETRRFELGRQEYTLRVKPSTPKIKKAQEALYEQIRNTPDLNSWEDRCERLYDAHRDWLELYSIEKKIEHASSISSILKDRQIVYERLALANDLNHERLVKLEIRKGELRFRLQELQLEKEYLLKKHGISQENIDFEGLMAVDEVLSIVQNERDPADGYVYRQINFEKELLDREITLEEAERKRILDFAQLRYEGPHDALLDRRISLGLGLNINRSGNRKLKILELQLEKDRLDKELERDEWNFENNLKEISLNIEKDITSYHNYLKANNAEKATLEELSTRLSQNIDFSPLTLLEIKERTLENDERASEMRLEILFDYVKYVYRSYQMCTSELVNVAISK